MLWQERLKKLETRYADLQAAANKNEFRVAGRCPAEIVAEVLARLFYLMHKSKPKAARETVAIAKSNLPLPEDWPPICKNAISVIRQWDQRRPGLPDRILAAIQSGATEITEDIVFPKGRSIEDQTYPSRHGYRLLIRLKERYG